MKKQHCKIKHEGVEYVNMAGPVRLRMDKDSMVTIGGRCSGVSVSAMSGPLWITQEKDEQDHVISEGGRFTLDRAGLAIVYSLLDSYIEIEQI